jgi:transcriptional regulator with XRE-family HTH domain
MGQTQVSGLREPDPDEDPFVSRCSETDVNAGLRCAVPADFTLFAQDVREFIVPLLRVYLASPFTHTDLFGQKEANDLRAIVFQELSPHFDIYDPATVSPPGSPHTDEEVYWGNHAPTRDADLVFAILNDSSWGVGIESQIAADVTAPRILAHPKGFQVSRMLTGQFGVTLATISYANSSDFRRQLKVILPQVLPQIEAEARERRSIRDRIISARLGSRLLRLRITRRLPSESLAKQIGVHPSLLTNLERDNSLAGSLSLFLLTRIAKVLDLTFAFSGSSSPTAYGQDDCDLRSDVDASLNSLIKFVQSEGQAIDEQRVFRIWHDYHEMVQTALAGREALDVVYTVDTWRRLYVEAFRF